MPELSISTEKVCFLIVKAREFDVQEGNSDPDSGSNAIDDGMTDVLQDHANNPIAQELRSYIIALSDDEKADLITLMQIGREDGTLADWSALRDQAMRERVSRSAAYLMGHPLLSDYLEEGLSQLGFSCSEFEMGRL
jgi:hypothetical protein